MTVSLYCYTAHILTFTSQIEDTSYTIYTKKKTHSTMEFVCHRSAQFMGRHHKFTMTRGRLGEGKKRRHDWL